MDDQQLFGSSDWRTRSPDADQEYFIDKMRMLKMKLRKYEDVSPYWCAPNYFLLLILSPFLSGESSAVPLPSGTKVRRQGGVA